MPLDSRAASRATRRGLTTVAEPRQHSRASAGGADVGRAVAGIASGGDESDTIIFGQSKWGTHKWGDGGAIVFGLSRWGRHTWRRDDSPA